MIPKPEDCRGCPLYERGRGFSRSEGKGTSGVYVIGEGLGREEYMDGLPFRPYAQAGSKLQEVIRLAGEPSRPVSRDIFKLWNMIACQPPENKLEGQSYEEGAINHCRRHFRRVVGGSDGIRDSVLLALGNVPLRHLIGVSGAAGEKQSIKFLRGYVYQSEYGWVVPSYHPSFVKRGNPQLTELLVQDMRKALRVAGGQWTGFRGGGGYVEPNYQTGPSVDDVRSFAYRCRDNEQLAIGVDLETPTLAAMEEDEREGGFLEEPVMIQFSLGKREGIAFPWREPYIKAARWILKLSNTKLGFNWYNFDGRILRQRGFEVRGTVHDLMWMWEKWHPRLDRHLQAVGSMFDFPFSWKHLYMKDLAWYGCADVDVLQWIWEKLPGLMRQRGVWNVYMRHVVGLEPIKTRMEERGFPVSEGARQDLRASLIDEERKLDRKIQEIHPDELKKVYPTTKQKGGGVRYGYVGDPPEVKELWKRYQIAKEGLEKKGKEVKKSFEDWVEEKLGMITVETIEGDERRVQILGTEKRVRRWAKMLPFKASRDQVVKYLRWRQKEAEREGNRKLARAYTVPVHLKTKKETTGKDELYEILSKTGDPLIELVLEHRSVDKLLNNDLENWEPKEDGCVHTTFHFGPPSGQLGSRRPNVQNASNHTKRGPLFRRIVEAPPGRVIVEFDKKSFHVAIMGYVARDASYIRVSQIDPHSIFTSWVIDQPIDPGEEEGEIREKIAWLKKNWKPPQNMVGIETFQDLRNKQCKHALLGHQNGIGPKRLWWNHRREIPSQRRAKELQDTLAGLFPRTARWQERIRREAHVKGWLQNDFGRICYFYDVFGYRFNKSAGQWREYAGGEWNEAVAWPIQSTAFDMLDEEMLRLEEKGVCEEHWMGNTIHDSLVFFPEEGKLDRCIEEVWSEMSRPCKWLVNDATGPEGLVVKVDVKVGRNWAKWNKEINRDGMQEI